jgi:hypothetical protein
MNTSKNQKGDAIKAYSKQNRLKFLLGANSFPSVGQWTDVVTLSSKEDPSIPSSSDSTSDITQKKGMA